MAEVRTTAQLSPSPISLSPWEHRSGVSIREAISPVYHPRALLRFSTRSPELSTLRALLRVIHGAPRLTPSPWNFCSGVPICEAIPLDYSSVRFAPEHIPLCVPHFTRCSTVSALRAATILCLLHVWPPAGQAPMGDYGWSMDSDTPQGIDAVEYGRVLEYPKRRNKSQTTRKPDLFR